MVSLRAVDFLNLYVMLFYNEKFGHMKVKSKNFDIELYILLSNMEDLDPFYIFTYPFKSCGGIWDPNFHGPPKINFLRMP